MSLTGRVTFTDGFRLEITCGKAPKPQAQLYWDGNPLELKRGELVEIEVRRK
jgi:hypothetical protein